MNQESNIKITRLNFKDQDAVCLRNSELSVIVLPKSGGNIASIKINATGEELLAQYKNDTWPKAKRGANFSDSAASGIDDVFPSISVFQGELAGFTVDYPDHGFIWTEPLSHEVSQYGLHLAHNFEDPSIQYSKDISLEDGTIKLKWHIKNTSTNAIPASFTFHGLFRWEANMKLYWPLTDEELSKAKVWNVLENPYAKSNSIVPFKELETHLEQLLQEQSNEYLKLYLVDALDLGEVSIAYKSSNTKVRLTWSVDSLPYLGLWLTNGGYRGDLNLAFEPTNGYPDDLTLAAANGTLPILNKGEAWQFSLNIEILKQDNENEARKL